MVDRVGRWLEIAFSLLVIALATGMIVAGRSLTASPFEPLGSAAVPIGTASVAILLGLAVIVQSTMALRAGAPAAEAGEKWRAVGLVFLITVVYASVLATGLVRYQWATIAFLPLAVLAVADDRRKALPWAMGLGLVYGFGLDALFRHVLVTDIP